MAICSIVWRSSSALCIRRGCYLQRTTAVAKSSVLNVATWIRAKDASFFCRVFTPFSQVRFYNAIEASVDFDQMDGLLLSGGADIAPEFLRQEVPDPSLLEKEPDPARDAWEFEAVAKTIG